MLECISLTKEIHRLNYIKIIKNIVLYNPPEDTSLLPRIFLNSFFGLCLVSVFVSVFFPQFA